MSSETEVSSAGAFAPRHFLAFVAASGVAALANFGSRLLFSTVMNYPAAISAAFCVGLTTAFVLNRRFIFAGRAHHVGHQFGRFLLVNLLAWVQTMAISLLLARWLFPLIGMPWHVESVAHAIGIAAPAITSYIAHKHWTFR